MKQACRDETIVSVFFLISLYIALYFYVSSTVLRKNQKTNFIYMYKLHLGINISMKLKLK